jgi:putative Flp pilus-assembly TadE/G-like protein
VKGRLRSEKGAVLVAGLLLTVAMMIVIGFAVDLGRAFIARRDLANVADQAALTASQAVDLPALHGGRLVLDPALARADALRVIGAEHAVRGSATAGARAVSVTVSRRVPTILLALAGVRTITIHAHATATPQQP